MSSPISPDYPQVHPLSMDREGRAAEWFRANARVVGITGLALALAAVGGVAWRSSERAKAQRAEQALFQAEASLQTGDARQTEQALQGVATRYAGTSGGVQAQLLLAQSLYDQGRYQDGLAVLGRGKPPAEFASAVRLLTAAGYEGMGRGTDAAKIYEGLAAGSNVAGRRRAELRAAAARAYVLSNDRAAALRLWQLVAADGDSGPLASEARVRAGELSARAG